MRDDSVNYPWNLLGIGKIDNEGDSIAAVSLTFIGDCFRPRFVAIEHCHCGAPTQQLGHRRPADARRPAGNNCYFTGKFRIHCSTSVWLALARIRILASRLPLQTTESNYGASR